MKKLVLFMLSLLLLVGLLPYFCFASDSQPAQPTPVSGSAPSNASSSGGAGSGSLIGSSDNNLFSGSFTHAIPLSVPPGIHGLQPNLALSYNSSSANGWCGMGWDLSFGIIQRSTKNGIPKYNDSDTFVYCSQGSSQELTKVGNNEYRIKIDSSFMKIVHYPDNNNMENDTWIAYDKNGTKYVFGHGWGESAKVVKPATTDIFSWSLSSIIDTNDNEIYFMYVHYDNQIYPSMIQYNHHLTESPPMRHIVFNLEDREDKNSNYRSGFGIVTAKRLASIETNVNGKKISKYELKYTLNQPSLLQAVTIFGSNDGTNWTQSLPATTFEYNPHKDALLDQIWRTGGVDPTYERGDRSFLGDFNGDGINDILIAGAGDGDNEWRVFLSTGNAFIEEGNPWWTWSIDNTGSDSDKMICSDFNNDGKADILFIDGHIEPMTWRVLQSDGTKFIDKGVWQNRNVSENDKLSVGDFNSDGFPDVWLTSFSGFYNLDPPGTYLPRIVRDLKMDIYLSNGSNSFAPNLFQSYQKAYSQTQYPDLTQQRFYLADFNGDSKTDILNLDPYTNQWFMFTSEGDKFSAPVLRLTSSVDWDGEDIDRIEIGDYNGDGLTDVMHLKTAAPFEWRVYLSAGDSFITDHNVWLNLSTDPTGDDYDYMLLGDYNADGKTDLLYVNGHNGEWKTYFSTGSGFIPGNSLLSRMIDHTGDDMDTVLAADFNGDGMCDIAHVGESSNNENWRILSEDGNAPNLLCRVTNNLGGVTDVNYVPSTRSVNTDLGFPIQVVDKITVSDQFSGQVTKGYEYGGGLFDRHAKEFLGFGKVTTIDGQGNHTVTNFIQELGQNMETEGTNKTYVNPLKGKILSQESYNGTSSTGTKMAASSSEYACTDAATGGAVTASTRWYFPYLNKVRSTTYDNNIEKTTGSDYEYDGYGNVTVKIDVGDTTTNDDNVISVIEYEHRPALDNKYIVNLPKWQEVRDVTSTGKAKTVFTYDDNGNLTAKESGLDTETNKPKVTMTYDKYGNTLTASDANENKSTGTGNVVTNTYDTDYHTFPVSVANVLGHTSSATYDPGTGNVLTQEDANKQTTTYKYDAFGRVLEVYSPIDNTDSPSTIYTYNDSTLPRSVHIQSKEEGQATGDAATTAKYLDTWQFLDGLGRVAQTQSQNTTKWSYHIISGLKEYNTRGLVSKSYTPFLPDHQTYHWWIAGQFYGNSPTVPYYATTSYTYDALGRVIRQDLSDGTFSTVSFSGWTETTTDPKGKSIIYQKDAFGRNIQITEHNNGQDYLTKYTYDTLGNLKTIINALGETTTINYDSLGRKTSMDDPKMGHWEYTYDVNGNLISQKDAKSQTTTLTYDRLSRILTKTYPNTGGQISYTYYDISSNAIGKLAKITDLTGFTEFSYDQLGRVTSTKKSITIGNHPKDYTTGSEYNASGQQTKLSYPNSISYPNSKEISYGYNSSGDLLTVGDPATDFVLQTEYNQNKQIIQMDFNNTLTTAYEYNWNNMRLTKLITGKTSDFHFTDPTYISYDRKDHTAFREFLNTLEEVSK